MVWQLDKLGRNLHEVLALIELLQKRGVYLNSSFEKLDTSQPMHREVIYRLFQGLSECERKQLVRRTQEGALKAKAQGNKGGRPVKLSAEKLERATELLESGVTHRNVADMLGVHRTTLTRQLATYSPSADKKDETSKNGKGLLGWFSRSQ